MRKLYSLIFCLIVIISGYYLYTLHEIENDLKELELALSSGDLYMVAKLCHVENTSAANSNGLVVDILKNSTVSCNSRISFPHDFFVEISIVAPDMYEVISNATTDTPDFKQKLLVYARDPNSPKRERKAIIPLFKNNDRWIINPQNRAFLDAISGGTISALSEKLMEVSQKIK